MRGEGMWLVHIWFAVLRGSFTTLVSGLLSRLYPRLSCPGQSSTLLYTAGHMHRQHGEPTSETNPNRTHDVTAISLSRRRSRLQTSDRTSRQWTSRTLLLMPSWVVRHVYHRALSGRLFRWRRQSCPNLLSRFIFLDAEFGYLLRISTLHQLSVGI